jgi:hypothetical protein
LPANELQRVAVVSSRQQLEDLLIRNFGAMIGGRDLREALGFKSATAFCRAVREGRLPIPVFEVSGRRGRFALATDVAEWLVKRREAGYDDQAVGQARAQPSARRTKKEGAKM